MSLFCKVKATDHLCFFVDKTVLAVHPWLKAALPKKRYDYVNTLRAAEVL